MTVELVVRGPLTPADMVGLCRRLQRLLDGVAAVPTVALRFDGEVRPDLATVDVLARLQLTARQAGAPLTVDAAPDALVDLLAFLGLECLSRPALRR